MVGGRWMPVFTLAPPASAKKGVKAIYLHDLAEWVATEPQPNAPSRLTAKEFERVLSEADLILTGSDYNRQAIKKRYPTFPDAKFRAIPPAVSPGFQRPALADQVEAVRKAYGLHRPYFLYAGTLETRKNLLRMVHAFCSTNNSRRSRPTWSWPAPRVGSGRLHAVHPLPGLEGEGALDRSRPFRVFGRFV
jgi:glycosyltransferase involved in cell wall biosynthesis